MKAIKPPTSAGQPKRSSMRRDLQGLRGIGILLVVIGHLWRTPPGVFAALDIFFVLSGFLITGILVDIHAKRGRVYFVPFYLSRARRLMPTAVTVIVVTTGLFYLLFSSARGDLVANDGKWALLFAANWHFALSGTDYFQDQTASPMLHYWSLSVEEQFYAVWPLLLLIVLTVAGRLKFRRETVLMVALGTFSAAFFGYSLWHSVANPTTAYYSTFDRAWEFGIGGMIAVARPWLARLPHRVGWVLGWVGTIGLIATIFLLHYGVAFPAPWALPAVLFTGAIVAGGVGRSTKHLFLIDNPVMIYVGDISYSMYLWHLPINLLLKPFFAPEAGWYYFSAVSLTMIAAVLSFHLLERPMRYAPWLMFPQERALFERTLIRRRAGMRRVGYGWLGVAGAATAAFCAFAVVSAPAPVALASSPQLASHPRNLQLQQQVKLTTALSATAFPELTPSLDDLGPQKWQSDLLRIGCLSVTAENLDRCKFSTDDAGPKKTAVMIGDSIGVAWTPGVRRALESHGYAVQQLTLAECPAWTLPGYLHADVTPFPGCSVHHRLIEDYVKREKPDLIVMGTSAVQVRNADRPDLKMTREQVAKAGLAATLKALAPSGARMVVLGPPPGTDSLLDCVTRTGSPDDCVRKPGDTYDPAVTGESAAAKAAGVQYVDTEDWFCVDSQCPAFVDNTPVTVDGAHLTIPFSESLAPLIRQAILQPKQAAKEAAEVG